MSASAGARCTFPVISAAVFERACRGASVYINILRLPFRTERVAGLLYLPVTARSPVFIEVHAPVVVCSWPCRSPCAAFAVVSSEVSLSVEVSVLIVSFWVLYVCNSLRPAVKVSVPTFSPGSAAVVSASRESTVMTSLKVAPVKSVSHAMASAYASVVKRAALIPAASSVVAPAVSAAISYVHARPAEIEVVSSRVTCIYGKMPYTCSPVKRPVEVGGGTEGPVLPVKQYVAQVEVTLRPVCSVQVVVCIYAHKVVKVNLISSIVLFFVEVQLIGHFVCEEQCLFACLAVAHRIG